MCSPSVAQGFGQADPRLLQMAQAAIPQNAQPPGTPPREPLSNVVPFRPKAKRG